MPVTIYDVAKQAGVGIGTVSRVLNGSPQISPETKGKVQQAIKELGYQPHPLAQGLARRKTHTVACIVPFFTGYFFVELLRGIQQQISHHKYDLILYSVDRIHKKETFLKKALQERKVDGVLFVSLHMTNTYARRFLQTPLPIVLVDSYHPWLDSITVENAEGARRATQHLLQLGYSPVAMIDGQLRSVPARQRLEGYKQALRDAGIAFNAEYVITCDFVDEADGFNKEAGYRAMRKLLDFGKQRPRAVFVSSDIQAAGAIAAVEERGLRIPEDVAIVGFDDIELAEYLGLTTMRQPIFAMGQLAVEQLLSRIAEGNLPRFVKTFNTELVVRQSCGAKVGKAKAA